MDLSGTARAVGRRTVTVGVLGLLAAAAAEVARRSGAAGGAEVGRALGPPGTGIPTGAASTLGTTAGPPARPAASVDPSAVDVPGARDPAAVSRGGLCRPAGGVPPSSCAALVPAQLPRGGRSLFPGFRLVGYSGGPGSAAFGRLGIGDLDARAAEIEALGAAYSAARGAFGPDVVGRAAAGRDPLPVFELIAVVAQRFPGVDGRYRERVDSTVIDTYLAAARRHNALLLLNIQPGRARFIDEVRGLELWLREPDVGVALDPEWAVRAPVVPGQFFGRVSGSELDDVSAYLAGLVSAGNLPEKAMVVHQLAPSVIQGLGSVRPRPGIVVIKSVDGIGTPGAKLRTWRRLVADLPNGIRPGFKLFFQEDTAGGTPLMTPADVLALTPTPDYILYE